MEQILVFCGIITGIGGAITVIKNTIIKPLQNISNRIQKLDKIEEGQIILMKSTASLMEHIITGNHIEKLKEDYDNLITFNIEH